MSKDGRDSATLILMKISHFDRTALYNIGKNAIGYSGMQKQIFNWVLFHAARRE